tara:strand:+ start:1774 stop:1986 length:213 start_codon:yes stop_codon:yes gene_type:complete
VPDPNDVNVSILFYFEAVEKAMKMELPDSVLRFIGTPRAKLIGGEWVGSESNGWEGMAQYTELKSVMTLL